MTSPYHILQKARDILKANPYCKFDDPRFSKKGIARTAHGIPTSPENEPAEMFTLIGALRLASYRITDNRENGEGYTIALNKLQAQTSYNYGQFLRVCDKLG